MARATATPELLARLPGLTLPQLLTELRGFAEASERTDDARKARQHDACADALVAEITRRAALPDRVAAAVERVHAAAAAGLEAAAANPPDLALLAQLREAGNVDAEGFVASIVEPLKLLEDFDRAARRWLHTYDEAVRDGGIGDERGIPDLRACVARFAQLDAASSE